MATDSDDGNQTENPELRDTALDDARPRGRGGARPRLPERYADRGLLGRGGMGEVRLCEDTAIGREVAVKLTRADVAAEDRARFVREALVQGRLEHPAIVPVYDVGALDSDRPFFTMKRVSGAELTGAGLSGHRLLAAFVLVCQAVEYAHNHGVLHRDLKPANIMIGELGEVYVLDWGLAKIGGEPDAEVRRPISGEIESSETRADVILGTPGYIAPERLYGEPSDHRADVFALGCILYEVLARRPLFRGSSVDAVLEETASGEVAAERIAALEVEVGPELAAICRRATAHEPGDRYDSAGDLWRDVEGYLEGDRDQARRRELAAAATERAAERVHRAIAGDDRARTRALADLGQALALDPDSSDARAALVRLLVEPPREVPAEVEAGVEASSMTMVALMARLAAISFAITAVVFAGVIALLGVESWTWIAGTLGSMLLVIALSAVIGWRRRPLWLYLANTVAIGLLVFSVARLGSPLLIAPVIAPGYAFLLSLHYRDIAKWAALGITLLAVSLPVLLELAGVLSPTFEFTGGALVISPQTFKLPPVYTELVIWLIVCSAVVGPTMIVGRLKRALLEAERRARVQVWQLERLVPRA